MYGDVYLHTGRQLLILLETNLDRWNGRSEGLLRSFFSFNTGVAMFLFLFCGFAIQINNLRWNILCDSNGSYMLVVSSNLLQLLNEKRGLNIMTILVSVITWSGALPMWFQCMMEMEIKQNTNGWLGETFGSEIWNDSKMRSGYFSREI